MKIRYLSSFLTIITLILSEQGFAQSMSIEDYQGLLIEDPSLLDDFTKTMTVEETNENLISESQNLVNSKDTTQLDLGTFSNQNLTSISSRYFKALTGQHLNIYGSNEFNQPQNNDLLFFNTIGKDYQLAPGDTINVIVTGINSYNKDYQVNADGAIALEAMYPIDVYNMTLDQVSKSILDMILLDDASAKVYVRLKSARLVTVQISGNVKSPRTIAVPAYTPLSRVIAFSGGISDSGSLRNITLSQLDETTQTVDFYNFLQSSSFKNDPMIRNGARIFIPNQGSTIAAFGFVNKPGIYELPTGKSEITIKELLSTTGTSFFPSGATLKVFYFNSNGQIETRLVSNEDLIKEGEALQIDFIETRNINISKVYGAVLKNYEIKNNRPLSIKDVLKDGAVLSSNAHYEFALIDGEDVQAISINDALENEDIILPPGSDLLVFSKEDYLSLVKENLNNSSNPITTILAKAKNISEIYLNGIRIAYVPVNPDNTFSESIRNFYIPGPKTIFDIALVENNSVIEAVDLKTEISNQSRRKLNNGDMLFIFEDKFYDALLKDIILEGNLNSNQTFVNTSNTTDGADSVEVFLLQKQLQDERDTYLEALSYSRRILQRANLINIKLDGKLYTYLPYIDGISSSYVLKKLRNRLPKLVSEFAVVQNIHTGENPEAKNLNDPFEIVNGEELNFISSQNYRLAINSYDDTIETNLLSELKSSNAVKVYYNGKLVLLLPPYYKPSELKLFEQYAKNNDLYKLYVGLNTTSLENRTGDLLTFGSEEFFSDTNNLILGPSDVVNLFSNNFIRDEFINDKININGVNFNINTKSKLQDRAVNTEDAATVNTVDATTLDDNLIDGIVLEKNSTNNRNKHLSTHIEIMRNSLRTITGSVQFPGAYPVAKEIHLSDFLSTAGLIEYTAKSDVDIIEAINKDDRLIRAKPKTIKINDENLKNIVLSGLYYLDIPLVINDAITGVIELKGEVYMPGKYSFTRSEKLQDILKRAGGLTDVAFPLGAYLQRVSAKQLEKETNNILADQLEASILNLAQSSLEGAGDQVKVVLNYAAKLRNQPTTGRMALNILNDNPSNPIFLEDDDILTIPKRPSHVSIVGSVQRSTIATYVPGQNYSDYLQSAGGVTKMADTRKAYLLLPNGESRQLNKTTLIPVGATIIIPPKLDRLSVLGGTDIISKVLSNISNSILSIQNVD